jgi:hypothetical protein
MSGNAHIAVLFDDMMPQVSVFGDIDLTTEHESPVTLRPLGALDGASAFVLLKLSGRLCHQFLLHIDFETAPNLSEKLALIAFKSHTCERMDPKQCWD